MVNPPKSGDESYPLYRAETSAIYESLKRRAIKLVEAFHGMEGVTCNYPEAREMPPKALRGGGRGEGIH